MDFDRVMTRLNPAIGWLLRSPLHGLLSWGLMLITVTGRRTGRRYTIPVGYQPYGESLTVLVSKARRKSWWRNYLEPAPVELQLRGQTVEGWAQVVPGSSDEFRRAMDSIFRRLPFMGRQFGIAYDRKTGLTDAQCQSVAENGAMVKVVIGSPHP